MTTAIEQRVTQFAQSLEPGSKVLDVGSGLQPYKPLFSHASYVGIDVESSGRKEHEKVADIFFDGTHIPVEDGTFDAVLCTEVLEHAVDPQALMAEMARVLRPGGKLCITVPFIWGLHELPYDFRRFTPNGLAKLVEDAGLHVDAQEKLVGGIDAIRMVVDSELNNYRVNIRPQTHGPREGWRFRIALFAHERLMRLLLRIWKTHFTFGRIYVDNHLVAHKADA